jgi:hypothetical protein
MFTVIMAFTVINCAVITRPVFVTFTRIIVNMRMLNTALTVTGSGSPAPSLANRVARSCILITASTLPELVADAFMLTVEVGLKMSGINAIFTITGRWTITVDLTRHVCANFVALSFPEVAVITVVSRFTHTSSVHVPFGVVVALYTVLIAMSNTSVSKVATVIALTKV